eukprot:3225648-Rhodomonas_salina.2
MNVTRRGCLEELPGSDFESCPAGAGHGDRNAAGEPELELLKSCQCTTGRLASSRTRNSKFPLQCTHCQPEAAGLPPVLASSMIVTQAKLEIESKAEQTSNGPSPGLGQPHRGFRRMGRFGDALSAMQNNLNNALIQKAVAATVIGGAVGWFLWRDRDCAGQKRMSEEDFDDAVDLAADAFVDSPAYGWFGGESAWRKEQLKWLFSVNFRQNNGEPSGSPEPVPSCPSDVHQKSSLSCPVFHLQRPPSMLSGLSSKWLLVLYFLPRYGLEAFGRVAKLAARLDELKHTALASAGVSEASCLTLERMVVHPSQQGKGLGRKHLGSALAAEAHHLPVFLTTQEERNTNFYSKLGFKVMSTQHVDGLGQNWVMLRLPPS